MQRLWIESPTQAQAAPVWSVLGPTGSGKTSAVLDYVRSHFKNPREPLLVSVDAIAIYRELNLGSAKPLGSERSDFDWAGIDCLSPTEDASVSRFLREVEPAIENAISQRRQVILVGGSHFYERALVDGLSPGTASSAEFIQSLSELSNKALHDRLALLDARIGAKLHVNDRYRLERYLDLVERQQLGFDDLFSARKKSGLAKFDVVSVPCLALGMNLDREAFEARLSKRIEQMLVGGWIQETESIAQKHGFECRALQSVGYREIVDYSKGLKPRAELNEQILISHRQLAKKQRTWIRGLQSKPLLA